LVGLLTDPGSWAALQYNTLRLFHVDILDNDKPMGDVLTIIERDLEFRESLLAALGALAAAAGVQR